MNIVCVVGARPNFMKMAPIMAALKRYPRYQPCLVHTGQHYDAQMKGAFFQQLRMPQPDIDLGVSAGTPTTQIAEMMQRFDTVLAQQAPQAVIVVGDVNSTLACALAAVKRGVTVIHVESGLRSYDRCMPEEVNRVITDQISDILFTTEAPAQANLAKEGIAAERVHFVGNVMIDTLRQNLSRAIAPEAQLVGRETIFRPNGNWRYALLTLHRPSNVDDAQTLTDLLDTLTDISRAMPIVFPVHPRTQQRIEALHLQPFLTQERVFTLPPQGYLQMLGLLSQASLVLTDSGGIQEETTALGVPCLTLRENTERPITVEQGTNTVVGVARQAVMRAFEDFLQTGGKQGRVPKYWDGQAAVRIVETLNRIL